MTVHTAPSQIVSLLNEAGLNGRDAIEQGEVDPTVYLLKQAGADLGYRFEWENFGPFSAELAADITELTDEDLDDPEPPGDDMSAAAARVRDLIEPAMPGLQRLTWVRLLASVHFLTRYSGLRLRNGDRPPYLQGPPFEQDMIDSAAERVADLPSPGH